MTANYYRQRRYISNSDLKSYWELVNGGKTFISHDIRQAAYDLGSYVDAGLTEGGDVTAYYDKLTDERRAIADNMIVAGYSDRLLSAMLAGCRVQHEVYRNNFAMEYNGIEFSLPMRGRLDLVNKKMRLGADIKSTAAKKLKDFKKNLLLFNYDQQGALYMDLLGLDTFLFIGIGKTPLRFTSSHPVFKIRMERGDELYKAGRDKYLEIAFNYYFQIHQLAL